MIGRGAVASGKKTRGLGSSAESGVALDETLVGDSSNASSLDGPTLDSDGASWARRLPSDLADLKPGAALAHFFVLGELGVGGMGVVLAAYDPDLDRKVAIKVLRAARGSSGSESSANARLLREAQALAKLSHPNVVTIFEVASTGDRVAVVMEYIDGLTLTQWLASTERNWREVIEVFCQAGRGLAAAHAAGLVHRDFKPDNVLVGKGGRVRVTDFGLVSTASEQTESSESSEPEPESDPDVDPRAVPSTARLSATLTCEGALLGTPAYMAPEQLDRTRADANADQFSFCVALYEGLYGSRPFSGQTYEELRDAVHAGRVNDAPAHSHVPGWVRELVVRGLRADPTERHPTMESLLAALERDRGQRRARLQWGAAVVGIVAIASVTVVGLTRGGDSPQATLCTSAEDKLTGVWDADVRDRMSASFVATDRPHAAETLALVDAEIERRTEAWLVTRSDACEATHVRGEQSEQLLDLRMHCLDRRLGEIRAMTALFAGASDSTLVDGAMKALSQMTPLAVCSDTQWLLAETPLPEDPAARKRVAEMRLRLDEITALERAGRYQNGIELAKAVAQEVVAVDYPPLRAEALHQLAELLARGGDPKEAEDALYRGLQAAADARDHELVAEAWIELILLIGSREGQHERALALRQPAEASVAQAGNHDAQVAQLASSLGLVLAHMGDYAAAHEHHARALEIQERIFGPDHSRSSLTRGNLANALAEQGMYPEARGHYERALASQDQVLGPHHPEIAFTLNNLGNVVGYQGDHEAAVPFFERALAIWQEALAPNHPLVGTCLNNLGNAHSDLGHPDEARTYYQRALDMFIAKFGSEHPATAAVTGNLGELEANQENYTRALELCGRSLTIYENTLGAEHPDTAYALTCIGRAHLGTNAARSALKPLRRALAARESNPGDPADLAETRFALARALWATREDRPSAIALAEQSRDAYAAAGDHKRREHDDVLGALQRWSSD
jgi:serine/threonine-protein kinase